MHRLARDSEGVTDLLPRPARLAGFGNVHLLDTLGETVQCTYRAEPRFRIGDAELG
jgi:hypothetical protein